MAAEAPYLINIIVITRKEKLGEQIFLIYQTWIHPPPPWIVRIWEAANLKDENSMGKNAREWGPQAHSVLPSFQPQPDTFAQIFLLTSVCREESPVIRITTS